MALSKADLIDGLKNGWSVTSLVNQAQMSLGQMVQYIDNNVNMYGRAILDQLKGVSKVGGNEMSLMEFVAWNDYHLTQLIGALPDRPPYQLIRDKATGVVYAFCPGVFFKVPTADYLFFLRAGRWVPDSALIIDAETNLVQFNHDEAARAAVDPKRIDPVEPPPPPATYTVVSGDTFSGVAKKLGVTVDALKAANPQVTDINNIAVGQVLNVPK